MKATKLLIFLLSLTFIFPGFKSLSNIDYENPNGDPFLISIGIEKNVD